MVTTSLREWRLKRMLVLGFWHTWILIDENLIRLLLYTAGMLCNDRLANNPENTVGILTMAGQG